MKFLNLISLGCTVAGMTTLSMIPAFKYSRKKVKVWPQDYKHDCYKWIIDRGKGSTGPGELIVCSTGSNNLFNFYLWWLKGYDFQKNTGVGQYYYPVESIQVEGDKISFNFKNDSEKVKSKDKALTLDYWNKGFRDRNRDKNITNLNGKKLEEVCQISSKDLKCSSASYETKDLDNVTFYW